MIKGIGNDIIEVDRIAMAIKRHGDHFLERCFTVSERTYCQGHRDSAMRFAGRWAAKEAIAKALGVGFGQGVEWQDIEIVNDDNGKPLALLSDRLRMQFHEPMILVTISHCDSLAIATAIWD